MIIIPAIDIIDGKCVRLTKGDYSTKKVYNADPLDVALRFEEHGIKRLHLVDLDGAREKHVINWKVLEKLVSKTSLKIDFGGGIKNDEDIQIVFNSGAYQATIGSVAVKNKTLFASWLEKYSKDKIILGADVKQKKIAVSGWLENTDIDIDSFIRSYLEQGIQYVLCTDISKDGMLEGTSMDLYSDLNCKFSDIKLIASGGISEMKEVEKLAEMNIFGVIIGKAIYEDKISLQDIEKFVLNSAR